MTASTPVTASDVQARIARLFVYPIKSCAGVELADCALAETGLALDRAWMVVDGQGDFVTQRQLPRMALVQVQLLAQAMALRAPGMPVLHLAFDALQSPCRVRVWKDEVPAWDMGTQAAQWFSDFLGQRLRLVRFDPGHRRLSSMKWTGGLEAVNQFADGYPVLVASQASLDGLNVRLAAAGHAPVGMERFRPNLVLSGLDAHGEDHLGDIRIAADLPVTLRTVKPCSRCPIPDIDPRTAQSSPEVGDTLQAYRRLEVVGGAVAFGMNAIVRDGAGAVLRVGQAVDADWRFD